MYVYIYQSLNVIIIISNTQLPKGFFIYFLIFLKKLPQYWVFLDHMLILTSRNLEYADLIPSEKTI